MYIVIVDSIGAWGITFGSFLIHVLMIGFMRTYSLIIIEYKELLDAPTSLLLVSSAMLIAMVGFISPLCNLLSDRFTTRKCGFCAAVLTASSGILMAYASNIYYLILSTILIAISFSMIYIPTVPITGKCHQKRQNISQGIMLTGSCVGTVLMPLALSEMIDIYSIRGYILIISAVFLHLAVSAALMPTHIVEMKDDYKPILVSIENYKKSMNGFVKIGNLDIPLESYKKSKPKWPTRKMWSSLILYSIGLGCVMSGHMLLGGLYGLMAESFSLSRTVSAYIFIAQSCVDLLSRLLIGYFVDLKLIPRWLFYFINSTMLSAIAILYGIAPSLSMFYIFVFLHAIFGAIHTVQFFVVLMDLVGSIYINNSFSVYIITQGSLCLILGYLIGLLCDITNTYNYAIIILGLIIGFGGSLILIERSIKKN